MKNISDFTDRIMLKKSNLEVPCKENRLGYWNSCKRLPNFVNVAALAPTQPVIMLPVHPASFAHNFVSGMQSFYFSESQDAIVLQTCHEKQLDSFILETASPRTHKPNIVNESLHSC